MRHLYERRFGGDASGGSEVEFPDAATFLCCLSFWRAVFTDRMFIKEGAMHIYYTTKGLRGRPYHSDVINTDLFAFFQGKRSRTIPSAETLRVVNAFPKCDIDMGEGTDSE